MKRHILASGLAAIATAAIVTVPTKAYAGQGPLSLGASELLQIDSNNNTYLTKYNEVETLYDGQAKDYALKFDDWFAINSFINHERAAYGTNGAKLADLQELDLSALTWEAGAHGVEAFFINEGAGYKNQFGYSTTSPSTMVRQPETTVAHGPRKPDGYTHEAPKLEDFNTEADYNRAMSERRAYHEAKAAYNTANRPLRQFWDSSNVTTMWSSIASKNSILQNSDGSMTLGEGYKIGNVAAGDTVNFFLRNPNANVFDSGTTETTFNADGLQHVTTYQYKDYLVLAYEDLYGGGDKDYNDVVIAVRGLVDTTPAAASVPEPTSLLGLLGLGALGSIVRRKREA